MTLRGLYRIHPVNRPRLRHPKADLACAWLVATIFSGAPSTAYSLIAGTDPLEATRAAGAMLVPSDAEALLLFAAAALVHTAVSLFWTLVFGFLLPRRHTTLWAVTGSMAIAIVDLRLIAPHFFPSVAALAFWPQFADHLMWGALLGGTLEWRARTVGRRGPPGKQNSPHTSR